jgi:D-alanyl-lipoteichoic acid acyltransferase DltB (MBOAT superfamily)
MLFPTGIFAIFFAVVFACHWLLVRHAPRLHRHFLLAASLVFYAWFSVLLCAALVLLALVAWAIGRRVANGAGRGWLTPGVALTLAWLGWCKYAGFLAQEAGGVALWLGLPPPPLPAVLLPVGVSFYCFQAISYMVDVHRGDTPAECSPLNVLCYLTFFPHIAAGPIVRALQFMPQLHAVPDAARVPVVMPAMLILGGLFKKLVIANELAVGLVDPVFRDSGGFGATDIVLAAYAYTIQIWCDFSAYSDMAIGVSALLGYHLPRNFHQPFRALSLSDFWRRWHISLSTWLRDYLYKPLGGSHGGAWPTARNLMLTMVLAGIWHGAAYTFVLWGALHGAGLVLERLSGLRETPRGVARHLLRWAMVFHVVVLGFVLFRAPDLGTVGALWAAAVADAAPAAAVTPRLVLLALLGLALHFLPHDLPARIERPLARLHPVPLGVVAGMALVAVLLAGPDGVAPFIYFQF